MASAVRLTNYDRDKIQEAAIKAAFDPRLAELKQAEHGLALKCYEHVFSAAERKAAKAMPKGWLHLGACLRFNAGGLDIRLDIQGDGVPVPAGRERYCQRLGAISDETLLAEIRAHLNALESLKEERTRASRSLRALLNSVSTLKILQATWPEGEPFWGSIAAKEGAPGLPAPQVAELNSMLGLAEAA